MGIPHEHPLPQFYSNLRPLTGGLEFYLLVRKGASSGAIMLVAFLIERRNDKAFTSAQPWGRGFFCFGCLMAGRFGL